MNERYVREFRDVCEFRDVPELRVPPNLILLLPSGPKQLSLDLNIVQHLTSYVRVNILIEEITAILDTILDTILDLDTCILLRPVVVVVFK